MKTFLWITMIIVAAVAIVAASPVRALLQDCDSNNTTTYTGSSGSWMVQGNWDNGVPDEDKCAVIPAGKSVSIPETNDAACRTLTMQMSGSTRSTLTIEKDASLKLGDGSARTSFVNGDIVLGTTQEPRGELRVDGVHTINGSGGTIEVKEKGQIVPHTDANDKLIITGDSTCSGYPDSRACSLTIFGQGYVTVAFDNRAFVVGKDSMTLHLDSYDMTGSSHGRWVAESGGNLEFGNNVTGSCTWIVVAESDGAFLIGSANLGSACIRATGPVTLESGVLNVRDGSKFCTTGKLTWKSVSVQGTPTSPMIVTAGTASATFGLGPMSTCPACN